LNPFKCITTPRCPPHTENEISEFSMSCMNCSASFEKQSNKSYRRYSFKSTLRGSSHTVEYGLSQIGMPNVTPASKLEERSLCFGCFLLVGKMVKACQYAAELQVQFDGKRSETSYVTGKRKQVNLTPTSTPRKIKVNLDKFIIYILIRFDLIHSFIIVTYTYLFITYTTYYTIFPALLDLWVTVQHTQ
jgi:hypothetical protein